MLKIRKLMMLGLFAACMVFIGDCLLGYGVNESGLTGLEGKLRIYIGKDDFVYFLSSMLGLIGIVLEGVCYFSIYRLIVEKSPKYAHIFRTGIIGYIAFGACGVHVPCLMISWLYNYLIKVLPDIAFDCCYKFGLYFLVPGTALFCASFLIMETSQTLAFIKGLTPYPKWCWIFNIGFGMAITMIIATQLREYHFGNALAATWISVGNIWQFAGLLITGRDLCKDYEN